MTYQPSPLPASAAPLSANEARAAAIAQNAASWWYWIAGFTLVNCATDFLKINWEFVLGTGLTQVIDAVLLQGTASGTARAIAIAADAVVIALVALWGYICGRGARWAFIVGIALYGLDTILVGVLRDWLGLAFHAYALYRIFPGIAASAYLRQVRTGY